MKTIREVQEKIDKIRICILCGEKINEKDNIAYSDNGIDQEPYICDFCYRNLDEVDIKNG